MNDAKENLIEDAEVLGLEDIPTLEELRDASEHPTTA